MGDLAAPLKQRARELGFELVGVARAGLADDFAHLEGWLAQGCAGAMTYMRRQAEARRHPQSILPKVQSVVMVGLNYKSGTQKAESGAGRIAQYAIGMDYHDVLRGKLKDLLTWVEQQAPGVQGRAVVDTAPLLERDFARRAGLGWIGKNTMLINKRLGSFLFLGALLLDIELAADAPFAADHCGSCTRCLDACPTQAFVGPHQLDARRCISYLTIELRGPIPEELRPDMGDWLFGCDVCQDVCPWNRKAPLGGEPALQPRSDVVALDALEILTLSEEEFRRRYRGTALWRTKRRGLVRNAAIVLANSGERRAMPDLERLCGDSDPVVAEAARWALQQLLAERVGVADNSHPPNRP
jgi:epoxyqueuosine reductase